MAAMILRTLILAGLAGCCAPPPAIDTDGELEFLHQRVVDVQAREDGSTWVAFGLSARWYTAASDDVAAAARAALEHGRPIHATVRVKDRGPKRPLGRDAAPFLLLRLAEDPYPRDAR